ncbi:uncharacterized protein BJX67DRAFT_18559 [Aspergillus lucknowensis]|uniref:Uncharacterized protein n=1 Tax=Aspergillus lucknowensis TaxID=176173 RepID=A0ABR4M855_9EURO
MHCESNAFSTFGWLTAWMSLLRGHRESLLRLLTLPCVLNSTVAQSLSRALRPFVLPTRYRQHHSNYYFAVPSPYSHTLLPRSYPLLTTCLALLQTSSASWVEVGTKSLEGAENKCKQPCQPSRMSRKGRSRSDPQTLGSVVDLIVIFPIVADATSVCPNYWEDPNPRPASRTTGNSISVWLSSPRLLNSNDAKL